MYPHNTPPYISNKNKGKGGLKMPEGIVTGLWVVLPVRDRNSDHDLVQQVYREGVHDDIDRQETNDNAGQWRKSEL